MKDDKEFREVFEPYRGALRLHCYRMLGSVHESDDLVQETLVHAWGARETLADRAKLRPWLYRIATNECLDELSRRAKQDHRHRLLASDLNPTTPSDPLIPYAPSIEEPVWLEPMPTSWIHADTNLDAHTHTADPSTKYELKESVALAFVAALQILSPPQRATLLLRDVVGFSADETAEALGLSVSATNSALARARSALETKLEGRDAASFASFASSGEGAGVNEALLTKYVRAFQNGDLESLLALLHDDIETTMPPSPTWIQGREANTIFYRRMLSTFFPGKAGVLRVEANLQPALAFYRADAPGEARRLRAINLIDVRCGLIRRIDHFMSKEVISAFGMPPILP